MDFIPSELGSRKHEVRLYLAQALITSHFEQVRDLETL